MPHTGLDPALALRGMEYAKDDDKWIFFAGGSSVTYYVTAANTGEVLTVTTNAGTPTITASAGCTYSISGNVLTFTGNGTGGDAAGAAITVSGSPFTSITLSHFGNGSGSLFTMDYTGTGGSASVPVSPWAIAALFLVISVAGYKMLRKSGISHA